jgi:hypothetical protein
MQSIPARPLVTALAGLAGFWLAIANWTHPVLRFASPYANLVALWVLMLLPWLAAGAAVWGMRRWWRWLTLVLALPTLLVGTVEFLLVSFEVSSREVGSPDPGFEPIRRVRLAQGGELVVYLTGCGAVCDDGVIVRHERRVLPEIRLVREVYDEYHAADAVVEQLSPDSVRVGGRRLRLRRWVWF